MLLKYQSSMNYTILSDSRITIVSRQYNIIFDWSMCVTIHGNSVL